MNVKDLFAERVDEASVARILLQIAKPPNRRERPQQRDVNGDCDFWFDGGAARNIMGWTEYEFSDGTRARLDVTPVLSVVIQFKDGRGVRVRELDPANERGFLGFLSRRP